MRKLLIGLFAASLIAVSAVGYAGEVTFVNKYNQPVTFVVSNGPVYNPIAQGTVGAGEKATLYTDGPFTHNTTFMAYRPYESPLVSNCGTPYAPIDNAKIVAFLSLDNGFQCRTFTGVEPQPQVVEYHCHHKYVNHHKSTKCWKDD